jgi:anti-sigma B factor antagonist
MSSDEHLHLDFAVHSAPLADGGTEITIFGDLDLHTVGEMRAALEPALANEGPIVIDLRACPFVDSSGLGALAGAAVRLDERGRSLVIRGVGPRVLRTFQVAGIADRDSITVEPGPTVPSH